jgi:hypothetical protein
LKRLPLFLFALPLFLSSCFLFDNDRPVPEQQLPPITNEGANTFGCRINGEVWVARSSHILFPKISGSFGAKTFYVTGQQYNSKDSINEVISFRIEDIAQPDTFYMGDWRRDFPASNGGFIDFLSGSEYYTRGFDTNSYSGKVVITSMDTTPRAANRHIAGIFWFTAMDTINQELVDISEGRFDFRLPQ